MTRHALLITLALASALGLCSCRSERKVYPVRGQVLYNGRPVPNAYVAFHPRNDSSPDAIRPAGSTDQEGRFTLGTFRQGDGAPPGEYAVTVEWHVARNADEAPILAPNRLPARYSRPDTSQLTVRVIEGNNELPPLTLVK